MRVGNSAQNSHLYRRKTNPKLSIKRHLPPLYFLNNEKTVEETRKTDSKSKTKRKEASSHNVDH